jgi:hypothetical protein
MNWWPSSPLCASSADRAAAQYVALMAEPVPKPCRGGSSVTQVPMMFQKTSAVAGSSNFSGTALLASPNTCVVNDLSSRGSGTFPLTCELIGQADAVSLAWSLFLVVLITFALRLVARGVRK